MSNINDGRGEGGPKGTTPAASVDQNANKGAPNEHQGNGGAKLHGPNPGKGHVKPGKGSK